MTWLLEDPWPIVILGVLGEVLLLAALLRTGRGLFVACMVGVALLTGLGVLVERLVVTDREEIEETLQSAAAALSSDEPLRVLDYIAPEAEEVRSAAQRYLAWIDFRDISLRAPETRVSQRMPGTATVRFTAHVQGTLKNSELSLGEGLVYLEVQFRKHEGRWLVTGYQQLSLVPGQQDPTPRERE